MHEWKMPMKYWGMLSSPCGPLGLLQSGGYHGRGGVPTKMAGNKSYLGIQYILHRNSGKGALK
jgi:hypothetical protein